MQSSNKNKIDLPANHRRAFSSTLYLIEKMLGEIEELFSPNREKMVEIQQDLSEEKKIIILKGIKEIRLQIERLNERYNLNKQQLSENHFVNSRITKIWELLHDSSIKRMNAYGSFPEELKSDYEADIQQLLTLVEKL